MAVGRVPAGLATNKGTVRVVAILGVRGRPLANFALGFATANAEDEEDRISAAGVVLYWFHQLGGSAPRWPRVVAGQLVPDARTRVRLATDIHPRTFRKQVLSPALREEGLDNRAGQEDGAYYSNLNWILERQRVGNMAEVERTYLAAKWGVPPGMYGEPTLGGLDYVHRRAQELADTVRERDRAGQLPTSSDLIQAEVDAAAAAGDLGRLAAWHALITSGAIIYNQGIHALEHRARRSVHDWVASGNAPPPLADALSEGAPLHDFIYEAHPRFGGDHFQWRGEGPKSVVLQTPRLIGVARALLGPSWWAGLLCAVIDKSPGTVSRLLSRFDRLMVVLARWRFLGDDTDSAPSGFTELPDGLPEPPAVSIDEHTRDSAGAFPELMADLSGTSQAAEPDTRVDRGGEIVAQIQAALAGRLWEVFRRVRVGGESQAEVARALGLSRGRVSQLLQQAEVRLRQDPGLRTFWEEIQPD
jgi:hypothetical protein